MLRSSLEAAQALPDGIIGEGTSIYTGERFPVRRFEAYGVTHLFTGHIEAKPHWAGESVVGVERVQPAAEIVRELADEAQDLLKRWC